MSDDREMTAKELRNQIRVLTAEVRALREELAHARDAAVGHEAELRELREERDRLADTAAKLSIEQHVYCPYEAPANCMRAMLARVEALCHMQHEDSAVSIGDIRAALRGEP